MPFKPFYGSCPLCPKEKTVLIVVKSGLCKFHNHQNKNKGKKPKAKVIKPFKPKKNIPIKKVKYGQCEECLSGSPQLLATNRLCRYHNEKKKKEAKSKKIVKLVDKAERKKSIKYIKKQLDDIYSLYIRWKDAKDGKNRCFTCNVELPIKELQDGHYESRRFLALRYFDGNNNPQCFRCNITLKGNYTVYALRMIEKYGKEHLDLLAIKKHNTVKWTAFEYQLLIDEYTEKVKVLMDKNK